MAHDREAAGAMAGMLETYGALATSPGWWDGYKRRWQHGDYVLCWHQGDLIRGHVMRVEEGIDHDTYYVRRHLVGGGSEIVEVRDTGMLIY